LGAGIAHLRRIAIFQQVVIFIEQLNVTASNLVQGNIFANSSRIRSDGITRH
jgi:hypothetical protein